MKTNDMKKGTKVKLANGWEATVEDNLKGNTRMCTVYGLHTEMGSVYSHDIVAYKVDGDWKTDIEYSKSQLQCKKMSESLFG